MTHKIKQSDKVRIECDDDDREYIMYDDVQIYLCDCRYVGTHNGNDMLYYPSGFCGAYTLQEDGCGNMLVGHTDLSLDMYRERMGVNT